MGILCQASLPGIHPVYHKILVPVMSRNACVGKDILQALMIHAGEAPDCGKQRGSDQKQDQFYDKPCP